MGLDPQIADQEGYRVDLHYLRDAGKREVHFLMTLEARPWFVQDLHCLPAEQSPADLLNNSESMPAVSNSRRCCRRRELAAGCWRVLAAQRVRLCCGGVLAASLVSLAEDGFATGHVANIRFAGCPDHRPTSSPGARSFPLTG